MFSATIDKIICFWVFIRWNWVIILRVFGTLWNLVLFYFRRPLILNFSQLKIGTCLIFPLFSLESFPNTIQLIPSYTQAFYPYLSLDFWTARYIWLWEDSRQSCLKPLVLNPHILVSLVNSYLALLWLITCSRISWESEEKEPT